MADQRSAGAVSEHSIKSSSHVESEHRIRASKKQGQIVKMHLLFGILRESLTNWKFQPIYAFFYIQHPKRKTCKWFFPFIANKREKLEICVFPSIANKADKVFSFYFSNI